MLSSRVVWASAIEVAGGLLTVELCVSAPGLGRADLAIEVDGQILPTEAVPIPTLSDTACLRARASLSPGRHLLSVRARGLVGTLRALQLHMA